MNATVNLTLDLHSESICLWMDVASFNRIALMSAGGVFYNFPMELFCMNPKCQKGVLGICGMAPKSVSNGGPN